MTLIVCVDNSLGMAFNHRRVSRDIAVTRRIAALAGGKRLWVSGYTARLFEKLDLPTMCVSDDLLADLGDIVTVGDDMCFVENIDPEPLVDRAERLVVFRWNRDYPSDIKLPFCADDWSLVDSEEFVGRSHECITMEVFDRCRR